MNIFILDMNFEKNVQSYVDKHVVKMPLETAQILCTTLRYFGIEAKYKSTHINHPCTKWARESFDNFSWLCQLGQWICKEYTYRYGKRHACLDIIDDCMRNAYNLPIESLGLTKFPQALPDIYKSENVVEAYKAYYNADKRHLFKWKNRPKPEWIIDKN